MCHVLIIEDDPLVADHIGELALDGGATSLAFAGTERDAIDAAHAQRPAVILSDVELSEGLGTSAVRAIATSLGPIPVVFITGSPGELGECESPFWFLPKPLVRAAFAAASREAQLGA